MKHSQLVSACLGSGSQLSQVELNMSDPLRAAGGGKALMMGLAGSVKCWDAALLAQ